MPKSLQRLIEGFKLLPGVGKKTAQRYAYAFLSMDDDFKKSFINSIVNAHKTLRRCTICNNYTEEDICLLCKNKSRDSNLLCIVNDPKDIYILEEMGSYNGRYHVLNGLISVESGLDLESLGINELVKRVKVEKIKEIIIGFKSGIEGETTGLYIKSLLAGMDVNITKFASGVPIGTDIEYLDFLTLERAFEERTEL